MFPFGNMKATPLTPTFLETPQEVEFTFIDGPFDGRKSTAKVNVVLTEQITVTMKDGETRHLYRYAGENTFKYEGPCEPS